MFFNQLPCWTVVQHASHVKYDHMIYNSPTIMNIRTVVAKSRIFVAKSAKWFSENERGEVKGHSELFRKFIRFGMRIRPLVKKERCQPWTFESTLHWRSLWAGVHFQRGPASPLKSQQTNKCAAKHLKNAIRGGQNLSTWKNRAGLSKSNPPKGRSRQTFALQRQPWSGFILRKKNTWWEFHITCDLIWVGMQKFFVKGHKGTC